MQYILKFQNDSLSAKKDIEQNLMLESDCLLSSHRRGVLYFSVMLK